MGNERIPPCIGQVPIVGLVEENEEVPLQEPQVALEPQDPQVIVMPKSLFLKGYMTNVDLRASLKNLTQLMTAQSHVINNNFFAVRTRI